MAFYVLPCSYIWQEGVVALKIAFPKVYVGMFAREVLLITWQAICIARGSEVIADNSLPRLFLYACYSEEGFIATDCSSAYPEHGSRLKSNSQGGVLKAAREIASTNKNGF